ncbi:hypothetical protein PVT71_11510 [Salipiger sp. H15]|uniref:Prevent-host-death protein n=1 Tax=Alloyangia sp. H15 TaxID=3029062 RepID=A0AAU8AE60_9RHOB
MLSGRIVFVKATEISAAIHAEMLARSFNQYAAAMEAALRLEIVCGAEAESRIEDILTWKARQRTGK